MSSPTPGWYPDPHVAQQMRWWDGADWTPDTYERTEPIVDLTVRPEQASSAAPAATRTTDDGVPLAGWWQRAIARVLDVAITGLATAGIGWSQTQVFVEATSQQLDAAMRAAEQGSPAPAVQYDLSTLKALMVLSLVWLGVGLVYDLVFLLWRAATPGKLLLGLRVRRPGEGAPLTASVVARRWLAFNAASAISYVGTLYLVVDLLWPLRDPRRQALHDKFAGTLVVRKAPRAP